MNQPTSPPPTPTPAPTLSDGGLCLGCVLDFLGRLVLFALLWLVIAGRDPDSWLVGAPVVLATALVSLALRRGRTGGQSGSGLSAGGLLRFLPFFLWESLRGGLDVAGRVLRPRLAIAPGFQRYPLRLTDEGAQAFFMAVISLLPGTLSADLREGVVLVHALDNRADLTPELARLERRVGALFGQPLPPV